MHKTALDVAFALRAAADDIQNDAFPRSYGFYARATADPDRHDDGSECPPNAPEAMSWCALGRYCYHLDVERPQEAARMIGRSAYLLKQLHQLGDPKVATGVWPAWDRKMPHEAAARMREIARNIETYVTELEAPTRAHQAEEAHAH